jgi:hypothetical protein
MSMRHSFAVILAGISLTLSAPAAATAQSADVTVTSNQSRLATQVGRSVSFTTTITNNSTSVTGALIAHLNVLSLRPGVEVDPEDWSTHRTRYLGAIPAAGSRRISWPVHAVNTGRIALYVAVLPQAGPNRPPAIGPTVQLVVAKRDTLNSGGVLPLALGLPALLGLIAGGTQLARRRR